MKEGAGSCSAELGSMTYAMKAQRALSDAAIPSAVYKTDSSPSRRGCSYGIRFSCAQEKNARRILERARISVKAWRVGE